MTDTKALDALIDAVERGGAEKLGFHQNHGRTLKAYRAGL